MAPPGSRISVTPPRVSMISRLTRVPWIVGTGTASIFKRRSPSSNSFPVAPPEKPIQVGFAPRACSAIATCAALPPGARWTSETRLTRPIWNPSNTSRVSMAGFKLTQKKAVSWPSGTVSGLFIIGILFQPRCGVPQARVDGLDVRHSFGFQPFLKRLRSTAHKDAHSIPPRGASTKDTAKLHARFGGELKSFVEHAIADARGEKQEWLCGGFGGAAK